MDKISSKKSELKRPCANCGAELLYEPGTTKLKCEYCGHKETIVPSKNNFEELELKPYLEKMGAQKHSKEITLLQCKNCGANQHIEENYKSLSCIYCNSPLIIEDANKEMWILPGAILPFQIDQTRAFQIFKNWVNGLLFAPNDLKKAAINPEKTRGLYVPYWTFDTELYAEYTGYRGEYYYVTKTVGSGKNRKTIKEQKTKWYPVSGHISGFVDDTLVKASNQKTGVIPQKIATWNLQLLKPFDSKYLSGFVTEKYTIPLVEGYAENNKVTRQIADNWIRRDIGGDTQKVSSMNIKLSEETFKHILLPVYISTYKFKGKQYKFFINGQSGNISGGRPYSFWKIFFLILVIVLVATGIYIFS